MLLAIPFPVIDPVLVEIGPLAIRWYALAYIAGIVLGWQLARRLVTLRPVAATPEQIDDFVTWVTLGIILGGRLGYVLFYRPGHYLLEPAGDPGGLARRHELPRRRGGRDPGDHPFARRHGLDMLTLADRTTAVVPIGLFFGRVANFINGELWGRASDVPWAMVFPTGGPEPRHPSQLYQAGLEGLALFALLMALVFNPASLRAPRAS
jgi:phosphatidylglycerol:prolipoprotein diacylglycerol transferase